jgi:hypothetical protein
MKKILFLVLFIPVLASAQVYTEALIPFSLDTDNDGVINVIDLDDDNDLALDHLDFKPLLSGQTGPNTSTITIATHADAGLRGNSPNTNYGTDVIAQTRNSQRSLIVKFAIPANLDLNSVTLTLFTKTENDPLDVYFLPNSNWIESGAMGVTAANVNLMGQQFLGKTLAPNAGAYQFQVPTHLITVAGGEFTLLIHDLLDPTGAGTIEELYTRETATKAATLDLVVNEVQATKLVIDQSFGTTLYKDDAPFNIGFKLIQAPSDTVYVPFALSHPLIAGFVAHEVLVFTPINWNVSQILAINALNPGQFDVLIRPLHSNDAFFNGHNENDLSDYKIDATKIINLSTYSIAAGATLSVGLSAISAVGSLSFDFLIVQGPSGLNVVESTGQLSFTPFSNQVGTHPVTIEVRDDAGNSSQFQTTITVTSSVLPDPDGLIVDLKAPTDPMADGSVLHPYNNIATAVSAASATGIDVLIRGVEYMLDAIVVINAVAPSTNPVVIKPVPGDHVKLNFNLSNAFQLAVGSRYIEIEGLEIDGGTDEVDFWCIVAQAFWGDPSIPRGGGIAINIDGQFIKIRNNYIHHTYQKAVELRSARYAVVEGNIIHSTATTSLSGGHGIMRQQKGDEFFDDDLPGVYRWDIHGNLIFNVEQRIYSWVQSKGFIEMVLDEGKPILIDDPKDTDMMQEAMSARIKNNIVAFGSIDHIRLKSTPNLEVSNNSVFSFSPKADGITTKSGDTNTPKFTAFVASNNAVQTNSGTFSIDLTTAIQEAIDEPGDPSISGNIASNATIIKPIGYPGITLNATNQLFIDAPNGNFRLNPTLGLPASLGADIAQITALEARAQTYGVAIKWDGWVNDELTLSQTILDNIPGLNDGISGNETVFTDYGAMTADNHEIHFDVVNGAWKTNTFSPGMQEFHLNTIYHTWYSAIETAHKNVLNQDYERIRYGSSHIKQNQVFDTDWLTVSKIRADTHTVILGNDMAFTLDGDLLIQFDGFIPNPAETFDLMVAGSIHSNSTPSLFDRVIFEGYTPPNYSLTVAHRPDGQQVLRLTILASCMTCGQGTVVKQ